MEETSEEHPNFSIGIDLLGPDPTSSKNKAELKKNSQVARFANLAERHSLGTEQTPTGHQQHLKVKFPFLLLFLNLFCTFVIFVQSDWSRKISLAITTQITVCGPWSATFPKMIKYFVEQNNTVNNKRYRDLLISILSYDEVSAFLLWVKTRN